MGNYVTFPDFHLYEQIELFDFICNQGELTKKHPNLAAYRGRVASLSGFKEYLESERFMKRPFMGKRAIVNN